MKISQTAIIILWLSEYNQKAHLKNFGYAHQKKADFITFNCSFPESEESSTCFVFPLCCFLDDKLWLFLSVNSRFLVGWLSLDCSFAPSNLFFLSFELDFPIIICWLLLESRIVFGIRYKHTDGFYREFPVIKRT